MSPIRTEIVFFFLIINGKLIEVYKNLKTANVGLNVINAEFPFIYNHTFINSNDTVDVSNNFRAKIRVIRAQAYL
jgi:hypothetical protein